MHELFEYLVLLSHVSGKGTLQRPLDGQPLGEEEELAERTRQLPVGPVLCVQCVLHALERLELEQVDTRHLRLW